MRQLTADDLETIDITRLVIVSQDHWHLLNRMWALIPKNALDLKAFKAASSKAVAVASCRFNEPYSAATPILLQQQACHDARVLQQNLLALVGSFRWQLTKNTAEERFDNIVRTVGAANVRRAAGGTSNVERGPETAPAAIRQHGIPEAAHAPDGGNMDSLFRKRTLAACNAYETVSSDVVRLLCDSCLLQ